MRWWLFALCLTCGSAPSALERDIAASLTAELGAAPRSVRCQTTTPVSCRAEIYDAVLPVVVTQDGWTVTEPVVDPLSLTGYVRAQTWDLGLTCTPQCPQRLWRLDRNPSWQCMCDAWVVLVSTTDPGANAQTDSRTDGATDVTTDTPSLLFEFVEPGAITERLAEPPNLEALSRELDVDSTAEPDE